MKSTLAVLVLTLGIASVMAGDQKTENYGYFESQKTESEEKAKVIVNDNAAALRIVDSEPIPSTLSKPEIDTKTIRNKVDKSIAADHSAFDALLKAHVSNTGKVDYAAIKFKVVTLNKYLEYLSQNVPSSSTGKNESLAFWINAYNANTIKLIIDNYPIKSIMDLYNGKAFDEKWIKIGSETLSLNDIENNKIRAKFNEPRIHFAVNCAAKSCPPILNKAWTADNVQANLTARTKAFVNDSSYNKISKDAVQISKIFEWYAKDFPNDIVSYLNKYSNVTIENGAKVSYIEYDWALNGK